MGKEFRYVSGWGDMVIYDAKNNQIGVLSDREVNQLDEITQEMWDNAVHWVSVSERSLVALAHQIIKELT